MLPEDRGHHRGLTAEVSPPGGAEDAAEHIETLARGLRGMPGRGLGDLWSRVHCPAWRCGLVSALASAGAEA